MNDDDDAETPEPNEEPQIGASALWSQICDDVKSDGFDQNCDAWARTDENYRAFRALEARGLVRSTNANDFQFTLTATGAYQAIRGSQQGLSDDE